MKKMILIVFCAFICISTNGFAQVKLGEVVNGVGIATHDEQDLIQALEKEYDKKQGTKFTYARILTSKDGNFWLAAGNQDQQTSFRIAVKLELDAKTKQLHISTKAATYTESCGDCKSPNCALAIDENNNPDGCTDCGPENPDEYCNHSISSCPPGLDAPVVRYLNKK